jgi:hypothetical protein
MARPATLTPAIMGEIARQRRAGVPWKVISADLRARGLAAGRTRLWQVYRRATGVSEHRGACTTAGGEATA